MSDQVNFFAVVLILASRGGRRIIVVSNHLGGSIRVTKVEEGERALTNGNKESGEKKFGLRLETFKNSFFISLRG